MGDPVTAGNELNRIHRPKMAWGMIGFIGVLSIAGLFIQYLLKLQMEDSTILVRGLGHNLFYMIIGMGVMIAVCHFDYSRIGYWARELMALLAAIIILNIVLFGTMYNGRYYFNIPLFGIGSISYMSLFLLFLPLYAGVLYSFRGQGLRAVIKGLGLMGLILLGAVIIPGITTAFILFPAFLVTLSIAVYKGWFHVSRKKTLSVLWSGSALLPFVIYFYVILFGAEYQVIRLQSMFVPSMAGGYQTRIIKGLVAGSRLLGGSSSVYSEAALPSKDYIIVYVAAYYGILVAVLLIMLIAFLFLQLLRTSLRQKNELGMLMGTSCAVVFLVQLVFYTFVNTGILQYGGIYCPFVTNGASGMMVTYSLLGLILSIYRYQNVIPQKSTAEGKTMLFL